MNLRDFIEEVTPLPAAGPEQLAYDVMIGPSDESNGDLWPIEEIQWDHNGAKVIIRTGYLGDDEG